MARDLAGALRSLRDGEWGKTLGGGIIDCVDAVRALNTQMGIRPYHVHLLKLSWTGQVRGDGQVTEIERTEILPVPKVADLSSIQLQLQSVGLDEAGSVQVSEISGRYTEFQLCGRGPAGEELDPNQEFMWEIVWARDDKTTPIYRRFHAQNVPSYNASTFQWTVTLVRASTEDQP